MADDPLIDQLKRWGIATATRYAANEDGPSAGDSPLARQRELGMRHRRKREEERQIVGRSGEDRRRFMAAKISQQSDGKLRLGIVPLWAVDPIPSRNDADRPHDNPRAVIDLGIPDDLMWIERAVAKLFRENRMRALILKEEFTTPGTHEERAARIRRQYGGTLNVRQYRAELKRALDQVRGSMAA
jgi:hypothetical protein